MSDLTGSTFSHYEILGKLGEGGMGVVYKAEDTRLHRMVALKFLPPGLTSSPEELARFQHEAEAISALNHPHIATLHDVGEANGQRFLVLEFIPGGTLKSKIRALKSGGQQLPLTEVFDYGIQMAEALAHAHRRQIVHRDVKTENVMLTEEGKVKLTDFGLARLRGRGQITKTGSTIGTAAYMSPEQIQGEDVDYRSDIFSFGIVLHELTTSQLAFRGEHEVAVSYSIVHEEPSSVRSLRQSVPAGLEQVISRCLEKDRTKRYQNADDIASDLRNIQQDTKGPVRAAVKRSKVFWIVAGAGVVAAGVAMSLFMPTSPSAGAHNKTIAVLPFANMSGSQEDEYFSEGITEDILTQLSKIADLNVISRTTMMQYKGSKKSLREIGKELNAGVVLEGSLRRSGDRIRIVGQLIDAGTDKHLWAETYDREMKDIFDVQSDVAQKIAAALEARLLPAEKERMERKSTSNAEAYNLYLKGRYYWNKRSGNGILQGIECFQQATRMDSLYALAFAGLADSYILLGVYNFRRPVESFPQARIYAERALAIDNSLAEAYASVGDMNTHYFWDFDAAERSLHRAIELDPRYGTAHQWRAEVFAIRGRYEEAIQESQRALDIEPYSLIFNTNLGLMYSHAGKYQKAVQQLEKTVDFDSTFSVAHYNLGLAFIGLRRFDDAIREFQIGRTLVPGNTSVLSALGHAEARSGRNEEPRQIKKTLLELRRHSYVPAYDLAVLACGMGETNAALDYLVQSYAERGPYMPFLRTSPFFTLLKDQPRFQTLLGKIGV